MKNVLKTAKYVTLAMCMNDEPYLVTLSHGYDQVKNCIYFHCAKEGRKVDIMRANPRVWGQALVDGGYQQGRCDHLYKTAQFHGKVTFIDSASERKHALEVMIRHLDNNPETIVSKQVTEHSLNRVLIGCIDIDFLSGKKADKVIVQL